MTVITEGWDYGDTSFRVPTAADGERTWTHVFAGGSGDQEFNGARIRGGRLLYGTDLPSVGDIPDTNASESQWDPRQVWRNVCQQGAGSPDMYARVLVDGAGTAFGNFYLVVRASLVGTALDGYAIQFRPGSSTQLRIARFANNTPTFIGTSFTGISDGDVLEIRVEGTSIKGYVNGVERVSASDASITEGDKVVLSASTTSANTRLFLDDLKAGPIEAGQTVETPIAPPVPVVTHAWQGGVTDSSAQVKVGVRNVTDARLVVSAGGSPVFTSAYVTPGAGGTCAFDVTGLTAATTYSYVVEYRSPGGDGTWAQTGRIKTAPTPGTPASFTFGFASCQGGQVLSANTHTLAAGQVRNPWTYERLADRDVDLFIHAGDIHYRNLTTTNLGPWRRAWRDVLAADRTAAFFRDHPISYTPDDHDYSYDFNDHVAREQFRETHAEFVPTYEPLATDGSLGHQIVWGRIRIINLDTRSERFQTPERTILGDDQKAAFKAALLAATEPLIFVNVGVPWNGDSDDAWGGVSFGASGERAELGAFINDNGLTDRVVLMHGDQHALAYDDGTNTAFGDGVTVGPKLIAAAPIESGASNKGGPYTIGPIPDLSTDPADGVNKMQYAAIEIADLGDQLDVTVRGMGASQDGVNETELMTVSWSVPADGDPVDPEPTFDPGTYYSTDGVTWTLAGAA